MKKINFENVKNSTSEQLQGIAQTLENDSIETCKKLISERSPYSNEINQSIISYGELALYCRLQLKEAFVTRRALIRDIDFDLWVSKKGKSNLQLMLAGEPPYAFDAPEGIIELHHIGQNFDAPFAELTEEEHNLYGNNKMLHHNKNESWRKEKQKVSQFSSERKAYWKKRGEETIKIITQIEIQAIEEVDIEYKPETSILLKKTIERIFEECAIEDLRYIGDLANSHAMIKEFGSHSFADFLEKNPQDKSKPNTVNCIFCGESNVSLYGYTNNPERIQRYKCKKCDKTFTPINKSIISGCSFSLMDWIKFIDCFYNGMSEDAIANLCNISKRAVHNYKLKVFYALKLLDDKVRLHGNIAIDETFVLSNFKGNRSKEGKSSMKRESHDRGGENHSKGLSKNQVCIVCAIDEQGISVARIAGLGAPTALRINRALENAIQSDTLECLYTDKECALKKYAQMNQYPIKQEKLLKKSGRKNTNNSYNSETFKIQQHLQRINSYHSRLKKFLNGFSGTSSRLLTGYLCLFAWKDRYRGKDPMDAYKELLSVMLEPNLYRSTEEIENMSCFQDVENFDFRKTRRGFKDFEKAAEIYARYAAGETEASIARSYGVSRNAISMKIIKFTKLGYAYKTIKEIQAEEDEANRKKVIFPYQNIERNREIYEQKMQWDGPVNDFYKMAMKKYKLSKQTIKNIISSEERIIALQEDFFAHETFSYQTLREVYQAVYHRYLELKNDTISIDKVVCQLSSEFNYTKNNIYRIIKIMSGDDTVLSKKTPINETLSRDRAVFADYLRWEGSKNSFCEWAQDKYNLSFYTLHQILRLNFVAAPKRYELKYTYPKQRKVKRVK